MRRQWEVMGCILGCFLHILGSFLAHLGVVFDTLRGVFCLFLVVFWPLISQFEVAFCLGRPFLGCFCSKNGVFLFDLGVLVFDFVVVGVVFGVFF